MAWPTSEELGMRCNGTEVARLRQGLGITQQDLADKARVSAATIGRVERGFSVDYQTIHDIAAVLGVGFSDLILSKDSDGEGGSADDACVVLAPARSAQDLMALLLRCETAIVELVDDPAEGATMTVISALRQLEALLPGGPNVEWDTLRSWRASAAERLRGLSRVSGIIADLAIVGLHLLMGEYMAHMSDEEAEIEVQNYIDQLDLVADGVMFSQPRMPDYRKRVAVLRVAKRGRTQIKLRPEDQARPDAASGSDPGTDEEDIPA